MEGTFFKLNDFFVIYGIAMLPSQSSPSAAALLSNGYFEVVGITEAVVVGLIDVGVIVATHRPNERG